MPIYEYRCASCGFQSEYLQKVSDPPRSVCPECGKATFNKLLTAAGFQLKGSGWYATDFKNNGARKDGADKKEDAKSQGSGSSESSGGEKSGPSGDKSPSSGDMSAGPACGAGACPACQ
jgi:putative FmdB family regulatory protein